MEARSGFSRSTIRGRIASGYSGDVTTIVLLQRGLPPKYLQRFVGADLWWFNRLRSFAEAESATGVYLIDGSNLLGTWKMGHESDASKRSLMQLLSAFSRVSRKRVYCFFDGVRPAAFPTSMGQLQVRFAHPRSADDLILEAVGSHRTGTVTVVTSDRGLQDRAKARTVHLMTCPEFRALLEASVPEEQNAPDTDWVAYFSDPKNRNL